jgi:beta-alanine--pyruvate transaminase
VLVDCFEAGLLIRTTGDIVALSPPLIVEKPQIDRMAEMLSAALRRVA